MSIKKVKISRVKVIILCFLAASMIGTIFLASAKAQSSGVTVGYWPLNEIKSSGSSVITPDQTGVNNGILVGNPEPQLVDGKFDKAMQFNGETAVYIPIKFVVGFPPMSQPMYVPISPNLDIQKYFDVQAWINVSSLRDAQYNNILVKCNHPDQACAWQNATRVLGLAVRAGTPEAGEQYT
jgi:hypothetical protein